MPDCIKSCDPAWLRNTIKVSVPSATTVMGLSTAKLKASFKLRNHNGCCHLNFWYDLGLANSSQAWLPKGWRALLMRTRILLKCYRLRLMLFCVPLMFHVLSIGYFTAIQPHCNCSIMNLQHAVNVSLRYLQRCLIWTMAVCEIGHPHPVQHF